MDDFNNKNTLPIVINNDSQVYDSNLITELDSFNTSTLNDSYYITYVSSSTYKEGIPTSGILWENYEKGDGHKFAIAMHHPSEEGEPVEGEKDLRGVFWYQTHAASQSSDTNWPIGETFRAYDEDESKAGKCTTIPAGYYGNAWVWSKYNLACASISLDNTTVRVYDGEEHDQLEGVSVSSQFIPFTINEASKYPAWNWNGGTFETKLGKTVISTIVNAGEYTTSFTPDINHCWRVTTELDTHVDTFTWKYEPCPLYIRTNPSTGIDPTIATINFPYTGNSINLIATDGEDSDILISRSTNSYLQHYESSLSDIFSITPNINIPASVGTYTNFISYTQSNSNYEVSNQQSEQVITVEPVLKFNANGGTGTMSDQMAIRGIATTINKCLFTKSEYIFSNWSNGTITYKDQARITLPQTYSAGTYELTANWLPEKYKITFSPNGGEGKAMSDQYVSYGTTVTLNKCSYTSPSFDWHNETVNTKVFDFWNDQNSNKYKDQAEVSYSSLTGNLELEANWKFCTYTIEFNANGGTIIGDTSITRTFNNKESEISTTANSLEAGKEFQYWKINASDGIKETLFTDTLADFITKVPSGNIIANAIYGTASNIYYKESVTGSTAFSTSENNIFSDSTNYYTYINGTTKILPGQSSYNDTVKNAIGTQILSGWKVINQIDDNHITDSSWSEKIGTIISSISSTDSGNVALEAVYSYVPGEPKTQTYCAKWLKGYGGSDPGKIYENINKCTKLVLTHKNKFKEKVHTIDGITYQGYTDIEFEISAEDNGAGTSNLQNGLLFIVNKGKQSGTNFATNNEITSGSHEPDTTHAKKLNTFLDAEGIVTGKTFVLDDTMEPQHDSLYPHSKKYWKESVAYHVTIGQGPYIVSTFGEDESEKYFDHNNKDVYFKSDTSDAYAICHVPSVTNTTISSTSTNRLQTVSSVYPTITQGVSFNFNGDTYPYVRIYPMLNRCSSSKSFTWNVGTIRIYHNSSVSTITLPVFLQHYNHYAYANSASEYYISDIRYPNGYPNGSYPTVENYIPEPVFEFNPIYSRQKASIDEFHVKYEDNTTAINDGSGTTSIINFPADPGGYYTYMLVFTVNADSKGAAYGFSNWTYTIGDETTTSAQLIEKLNTYTLPLNIWLRLPNTNSATISVTLYSYLNKDTESIAKDFSKNYTLICTNTIAPTFGTHQLIDLNNLVSGLGTNKFYGNSKLNSTSSTVENDFFTQFTSAVTEILQNKSTNRHLPSEASYNKYLYNASITYNISYSKGGATEYTKLFEETVDSYITSSEYNNDPSKELIDREKKATEIKQYNIFMIKEFINSLSNITENTAVNFKISISDTRNKSVAETIETTFIPYTKPTTSEISITRTRDTEYNWNWLHLNSSSNYYRIWYKVRPEYIEGIESTSDNPWDWDKYNKSTWFHCIVDDKINTATEAKNSNFITVGSTQLLNANAKSNYTNGTRLFYDKAKSYSYFEPLKLSKTIDNIEYTSYISLQKYPGYNYQISYETSDNTQYLINESKATTITKKTFRCTGATETKEAEFYWDREFELQCWVEDKLHNISDASDIILVYKHIYKLLLNNPILAKDFNQIKEHVNRTKTEFSRAKEQTIKNTKELLAKRSTDFSNDGFLSTITARDSERYGTRAYTNFEIDEITYDKNNPIPLNREQTTKVVNMLYEISGNTQSEKPADGNWSKMNDYDMAGYIRQQLLKAEENKLDNRNKINMMLLDSKGDTIDEEYFNTAANTSDRIYQTMRAKPNIDGSGYSYDTNDDISKTSINTNWKWLTINEINDCKGSCLGLCESGCYQTCVGGCETTCGTNCETFCGQSCRETCSSNCSRGCGGCDTSCSQNCGEDCEISCANDCKTSCEDYCYDSCKTFCSGDCGGSTCFGTCSANCKNDCKSTCGDSCTGTCKNGCKDTCGKDCTQECGTTCTVNCTGICDYQCGNNCQNSCGEGCNDNCSTTCHSGCKSGCTNRCDTNCWLNCSGTCGNLCSGQANIKQYGRT